jgi:hypothetical protein
MASCDPGRGGTPIVVELGLACGRAPAIGFGAHALRPAGQTAAALPPDLAKLRRERARAGGGTASSRAGQEPAASPRRAGCPRRVRPAVAPTARGRTATGDAAAENWPLSEMVHGSKRSTTRRFRSRASALDRGRSGGHRSHGLSGAVPARTRVQSRRADQPLRRSVMANAQLYDRRFSIQVYSMCHFRNKC